MNMVLRSGLLLVVLLLTNRVLAEAPATPETVAAVDLTRYAGTWYEVARLPNRFQDQCAGEVTAHYTLRTDGRVDVINRCRTHDGVMDEAQGLARVREGSGNAKLEVSFASLLGWHFFWGDYWILELDRDYQYAVVGHPGRKYGWILSRTPRLDPLARRHIDEVLVRNGYDPGKFMQSGG